MSAVRPGVAWRIGSGPLAFAAFGFGIPAVAGAIHFARTGAVWQLWGFPSYGPGLFEAWGLWSAPIALMAIFAVACGLAAVCAVLLWIPRVARIGAVAGLVLIVVQSVFWIGFQLPFGPPLGILAAIALVAGLIAPGRDDHERRLPSGGASNR